MVKSIIYQNEEMVKSIIYQNEEMVSFEGITKKQSGDPGGGKSPL